MNKCKCGCGKEVKNKYARGHNVKKQDKFLICWKCKMKSSNLSLFMVDKRLSSGHKNLCRNCNKKVTREIYQSNIDLLIKAKNIPCKLCGKLYPHYVMDLHHKNPKEKDFGLSSSMLRSNKTFLKEIKKCDVYCANCHRIIERNAQAFFESNR